MTKGRTEGAIFVIAFLKIFREIANSVVWIGLDCPNVLPYRTSRVTPDGFSYLRILGKFVQKNLSFVII